MRNLLRIVWKMPSCTSKTASGTTCSFIPRGLPFWGGPNPHPRIPEKIVEQNGAKNVGNQHPRPQHLRCDQNIPGHHWQGRSVHQEGAFHTIMVLFMNFFEKWLYINIWNHILVACHRFFLKLFHVLVLFKFRHWHRFCKPYNMAKILGSTEHWTQFPNLPPFQSHPNLWTLYGWNWDFWDFRTKPKKKEISFGLFCVNAQHLPTGSMASLHPQRCYLQRFRPRYYDFRGRISSKPRKNSFKSCLQHRSIVQAHQKDPSWKRRPTAKQRDFKQQRDTRNFVHQYMRNTSKAFFAFGYFFLPWHFTTNNTNTHLISWFLACGRWTIGFVPEVQCSTHLRIDDLDRIKIQELTISRWLPINQLEPFISSYLERFTPFHSRCEGKIWKNKKDVSR